jgi:DNA-binding MurR/RpiR family transcriptional regulator
MSYETIIREMRPNMSKSFGRLADYILDSYLQAALMTATELAHKVDVDAATVVRFAQKLGYSGFPPLQVEIKEKVMHDLLILHDNEETPNTLSGIINNSLSQLSSSLEQTKKLIDTEELEKMAEMVGSSRRIILIPDDLGRAAAQNLLNILEQGGFIVNIIPAGLNNLARTISALSKDDLIIAIDVADDGPYISRALQEATLKKAHTIAIVGSASFLSARVADNVLAAQQQTEDGLGIVIIDSIIFAFSQAIKWMYKGKFKGAKKSINKYYERIQKG